MKKILSALLLCVVFFGLTGMTRRPDPNTKAGCFQRPVYECPGWRWSLDNPAAACANRIYDECRCKWAPEQVEQYNINKVCTTL